MRPPVSHRFPLSALIALLLAVGITPSAWSQSPTAEDRLRVLEEQNRQILERLKESESRNAALETEIKTIREDGVDPHSSKLETQINTLSGKVSDGIAWKQLTRSGFPIKFYGFVRLDAYYTTARMDNTVIPFWVRNESNGEAEPNDDAFAFDSRLTRFGFDIDAGKVCDAAVTGKVETDFANFVPGVVESRETLRMRLAYINIKFSKTYLRFGQDWDVISPLFPSVNAESLMWNAGNLGDRRPQAQFGWSDGDPKCMAFDFKISAGMTGAINNQDLDPTVAGVSNERDGFDSGLPHLQARAGVTFKSWVCDQTASIGAWGAIAAMETDTEFSGEDEFTSWLVGVDWTVPIFEGFKWRGEVWAGTALADFRGGIGQAINTTQGEEIDAIGGWSEIVFEVTKKFTMAAGGTVDDPDDDDLDNNNRDLNWSLYLATKYDFGGGLKAGLDAIFWETQYLDTGLGNTMRFDIYTQLDF